MGEPGALLELLHDLLPEGAVVIRRRDAGPCVHWAPGGNGYREGRWSAGLYTVGVEHAAGHPPLGTPPFDSHSYTVAIRDELPLGPGGSVVELLLVEIARLRGEVERLKLDAEMSCSEPADDCDCSGCLCAADHYREATP